MSSSVGATLSSSCERKVSLSYVTGRKSRGATPMSACACSSFFSKPLTEESENQYCAEACATREPGGPVLVRTYTRALFLLTMTMRSTLPASSSSRRKSANVISCVSCRVGSIW